MAFEDIRLVALDADGVLTDGKVFYGEQKIEGKFFSVRDGFALGLLRKAGIKSLIISGKKSGALIHRSRHLGVDYFLDGVKDKLSALLFFCRRHGYTLREVCYMGDDIPDIPVLKKAGFSAAPADAVPEVRKAVDFVSSCAGGDGAVRELVEKILKGRNLWKKLLKEYF
jgi:3-deoxy-D-manno-octulosonate 8-phosphate phosphatase (KDO 8-P phosphatase)